VPGPPRIGALLIVLLPEMFALPRRLALAGVRHDLHPGLLVARQDSDSCAVRRLKLRAFWDMSQGRAKRRLLRPMALTKLFGGGRALSDVVMSRAAGKNQVRDHRARTAPDKTETMFNVVNRRRS